MSTRLARSRFCEFHGDNVDAIAFTTLWCGWCTPALKIGISVGEEDGNVQVVGGRACIRCDHRAGRGHHPLRAVQRPTAHIDGGLQQPGARAGSRTRDGVRAPIMASQEIMLGLYDPRVSEGSNLILPVGTFSSNISSMQVLSDLHNRIAAIEAYLAKIPLSATLVMPRGQEEAWHLSASQAACRTCTIVSLRSRRISPRFPFRQP
jgi:hypothetical protein